MLNTLQTLLREEVYSWRNCSLDTCHDLPRSCNLGRGRIWSQIRCLQQCISLLYKYHTQVFGDYFPISNEKPLEDFKMPCNVIRFAFLEGSLWHQCREWTESDTKLEDQRRGRGITRERRGRSKQMNMNRGLMGTDNWGDWLWERWWCWDEQ